MNNSLTHNGASLMNISRDILSAIQNMNKNNGDSTIRPYYDYYIYIDSNQLKMNTTIEDQTNDNQNTNLYSFYMMYESDQIQLNTSTTPIYIQDDSGNTLATIYTLIKSHSTTVTIPDIYVIQLENGDKSKYYAIDTTSLPRKLLGLVPLQQYFMKFTNTSSQKQVQLIQGFQGYNDDGVPIYKGSTEASNTITTFVFALEDHPEILFYAL